EKGFWLDMDMIPFGHLQLWNPKSKARGYSNEEDQLLSGKGYERMSSLNEDQKMTFITMRALAASPLFMGGALPTSDEFSFQLITNKMMIACNQNGVMGRNIYQKKGLEVWVSDKKGCHNEGWIGIFNRTDKAINLVLTQEELSL